MNLNSYLKNDFRYTISFAKFNNKIREIVENPYWQELGKVDDGVGKIKEMRKILDNAELSDAKRFEKLSNLAKRVSGSMRFSVLPSPHPEVKTLCEAILKKDSIQLETVSQSIIYNMHSETNNSAVYLAV